MWAFFQQLLIIDNFIEFRVFLGFWGDFLVFFLANYLLISLQNNRYSVRRQIEETHLWYDFVNILICC
jgi:hypothetical protein